MGKTLGILAAWSWHRLHRGDESWPRRLVWCLPMRVLVEQTEAVVRDALQRLGLLWDGSCDHKGKVGVHLLMGGTDPGGDWNLFPEACAVLIGTQDMLLSRALNRGYASGRARWPQDFGLLGHDALWVMDEVQLMDVGLATSAQLQAYHDEDGSKGLRPRQTWWMSATLQPAWLRSVDTKARWDDWVRDPIRIEPGDLEDCLGARGKALSTASIAADDTRPFAERAWEEHSAAPDGSHGRITLVVCNTVQRAISTYDALRGIAPAQQVELVHSRFRPAERSGWRSRFLSREACAPGADRIIVATQVVEAGVDISAGCLVTDLAPWPSLVQRFGRCARYGGEGKCLVVDRGRDESGALPYELAEIEAAWGALAALRTRGGDVGTAALEEFEAALDREGRGTLFPYAPRHLLLRSEFEELFDTTPDLSGADLDISRFIRAGDERDLQVFWREIPPPARGEKAPLPSARLRAQQSELCPVKFLAVRDWLCGRQSKERSNARLLPTKRAWVWDWTEGAWVVADRSMLTPGRVVLVAADSGGYRLDRGFDPDSSEAVPIVPLPEIAPETEAEIQASESEGADDLSVARWKTIACHGGEVAGVARDIGTTLGLPHKLLRVLALAGNWHDLGKAHPAFQGAIQSISGRPDRQDLAKAPPEAWLRPPGTYRTADGRDERRGLRHELASALALFAVLERHAPMHPALLGPWSEALRLTRHAIPASPDHQGPTPCEREVLACSPEDFDLLAYLVACHHGKVRMALHAGPHDQDYRDPGDGRGLPIRGVREGDVLPAVALDASAPPLPPLELTLEPASLGLSPRTGRSWRERTLDLLERFGPGALAWLEAILIAADRRASRLATSDPSLETTEAPQ
jgi:CRISPR-associated endonuclease/helicase Cas3